MAVTLTILTIPSGSQLTSTIASDEPESKNDFEVRLVLDGNGTGLEESDITLSTGASLVELTGAKSVWEATIRPPTTAGTLMITIGADAFSEGNVETTQDIRVSTAFPDADAEATTSLFTHSVSSESGIAVTPTRILISHSSGISKFTHDGTLQSSEAITAGLSLTNDIDVINGDILFRRNAQFGSTQLSTRRYKESSGALTQVAEYTNLRGRGITHTRLGFATMDAPDILIQKYGETDVETHEQVLPSGTGSFGAIAHQDDILYFSKQVPGSRPNIGIAEITTDAEINYLKGLNVEYSSGSVLDVFAFQDTLYLLDGNTDSSVSTLDIRPYRPIAKNTKTTIYPVFANEGDTLPLKQFCPDAHMITFGTGFDKPTYLSINADNELEIASNAVTETHPVLVRLTGINYIDAVDFSFYLIIVQATNPTVRDVADLAMYASTTFDLFDIVDNATAITFRSGQTQPTDSSISGGVFTIGTVGGTAYFTATNANGSTNFEIAIDVVSVDADNFSDTFRYRTEIAGIDVSGDVKGTPTVSESIDAVRLNVNTANRVNLTLRSDSTNGFKFNGGIADNFWDANSLNADGFQEPIKVYIESLISGSYVRSLLFSGSIHEPAASINAAEVRISAIDLSTRLRNALVSDFGTLIKWDGLKQQSDEVNYEGVNIPESSLLPIQLGTGTAWSDRTKLEISRLPLPSEGPAQSNTGYLTSQDFRTAGGFLASLPILRFKTEHRAEDVRFLFKQLGINKNIYQTQIDIPAIERETPFILNRGSVPFSVEDTRITRLPTDWAHDSTNDRVLILLSNPESHIADLLVQYNLDSDAYRSLHTFDTGIKTHRITRRNANNYYILTSAPITQDRSAANLPRQSDKTAYAFDSRSVGSDVRIYAYNTNTGVLTAHVEETDTYPPQLGIHYWIGFENAIYADEFEGVTSDYRGAFPVQSGTLYYRYAKDGEFGIASVDTSGTTTGLISQSTLNYHNHLNFAFDLTSGGDIYFVYAEGDADESTLTIKRRTSGGTESTILTDTQDLADLTALDEAGGAYLGCHEALFHDDTLYMLCPIQRVDADDASPPVYTRSREKAAGMVLFSCDITAGTPSLTVIEKWDFVTHSAANLTVHDGNVHYVENPASATRFRPINSDL